MRRKLGDNFCIAATACAVFFLFALYAYAAPVGGPVEDTGEKDFEFSLDRLSVDGGATEISARDLNDAADIKEGEQVYAQLGYNIYNDIIMYAKLGIADLELTGKNSSGNNFTERFGFGPLFGAGIKGTFTMPKDVKLTGDLQYQTWTSDLEKYTDDQTGALSAGAKGDIEVTELHIAGTLGRTLYATDNFSVTPYAGGKFSKFFARENDLSVQGATLSNTSRRSDAHLGLVFGANLGIGDNFSVNAEGRFFDEYAATVSVRYNWALGRLRVSDEEIEDDEYEEDDNVTSRYESGGWDEKIEAGEVRLTSKAGGLTYQDLPRNADEYYRAVRERVKEYIFYPAGAPTGEVYVSFTLLQDGSAADVEAIDAFGNYTLEEFVIQAIRNAEPFPHFPKDMAEPLRFNLSVSFANEV